MNKSVLPCSILMLSKETIKQESILNSTGKERASFFLTISSLVLTMIIENMVIYLTLMFIQEIWKQFIALFTHDWH